MKQIPPQPDGRKPATPSAGTPKRTRLKSWLWFLGILLLNYFVVRTLFPDTEPVKVPYTLFKTEVGKKNVEAIYSRGESITGRFVKSVTYPARAKEAKQTNDKNDSKSAEKSEHTKSEAKPQEVHDFTTTLPSFVDPGLEAFLIEHGVEIRAEPIQEGSNPIWTLLFGFGPALLLIGFYVWMYRRAA